MNDKASPRPWRNVTSTVGALRLIIDANGNTIDRDAGILSANAELIVRAVNSHDELIESCEDLLLCLKDAYNGMELTEEDVERDPMVRRAIERLAKAKGAI